MDLPKIISLIISLTSGTGPLTDIVKLVLQLVGKIQELFGAAAVAPGAGMDVAWVQRALKKMGFDPGPLDGILGPLTQKAIVQYQQSKGLTADGWMGGETQTALRLDAGDA